MKYYSLNRQSDPVDFKTATILGQAPDRGLYFPEEIPLLSADFFSALKDMPDEEICYQVIRPYVGECIPDLELRRIVAETVSFQIPLKPISDNISVLEMFHGNTLAFKDIGARFMSRCLGYFMKGESRKVTVLVATSGDTGGAVADGFYGVEGVQVVILFPEGKVSKVQEQQLTTFGGNIHAVSVQGNFDDCQRMVKQAFADEELKSRLFLTSANSINVARWLPQQFFYFLAIKQWMDLQMPPVISVPSGNFGNICAGLLAKKSGLPVAHFIAACNANKVVPAFMENGNYQPQPAIATISNAMDVGDPSNFIRIMEIYGKDRQALQQDLTAVSISESETRESLLALLNTFGYLADPHGAVGYTALKNYLSKHPESKGIFAETAHPVKFYDVVEPLLGLSIELPDSVIALKEKPTQVQNINPDFHQLRNLLFKLD